MKSYARKAKRPAAEDKYPGLSVLNFRFLFKKAEEIFRALGSPAFPSPYSIIPLISQAMGLDIPMMGSGKSPYSIVSFYSRFKADIFLKNSKEFNYRKRRELIDEIYDMLAPYLLEEQEEYIDLLAKTKYKYSLKQAGDTGIAEFKSIMMRKFDILDKFLKKIEFTGGDFSHIAHYGYLEDLYREQEFIKSFDSETYKIWAEGAYPVVIETQLDGFKAENETICGWYIFMPNYTEELLRDKKLRHKKLLQAAKLAKRLHAKFAGMAGLIASFSKGGKVLVDNIDGFGFTTGHSFTIANIYEIVKNIIKAVSLDLTKSAVVIVGAAGSIGSGVAKLISENKIKEVILIDMPNMVASAKLERLRGNLQKINPKNIVRISKKLDDAKKGDLLIVATNATTSFLTSEYLKTGAVIIDDSFPKNVSKDTVKSRDDIILLEGGATQMPQLNIDVSRHMPDLLDLSISKLISCSQAYGCLAETFILAALRHKESYGLGDADPLLAKDIMSKGCQVGFKDAVFQSYGYAVEESRINKVKRIIKKR